MITTETEFCPHCEEDRTLIYRRRQDTLRGHWLCSVCSFPIRAFKAIEELM